MHACFFALFVLFCAVSELFVVTALSPSPVRPSQEPRAPGEEPGGAVRSFVVSGARAWSWGCLTGCPFCVAWEILCVGHGHGMMGCGGCVAGWEVGRRWEVTPRRACVTWWVLCCGRTRVLGLGRIGLLVGWDGMVTVCRLRGASW